MGRTEEGEDLCRRSAERHWFQISGRAAYPQATKQGIVTGEIRDFSGTPAPQQLVVQCVLRRSTATPKPGLALRSKDTDIHAIRNSQREASWSAVCLRRPQTNLRPGRRRCTELKPAAFAALQRTIKSNGTGKGYVQQIMDISDADAAVYSASLNTLFSRRMSISDWPNAARACGGNRSGQKGCVLHDPRRSRMRATKPPPVRPAIPCLTDMNLPMNALPRGPSSEPDKEKYEAAQSVLHGGF
jgi:hypothetical protein